jgi:hypothetical protein
MTADLPAPRMRALARLRDNNVIVWLRCHKAKIAAS